MKKEKTPAFQFYPKDWLSDINVIRMSLEQRGMYIHLLSFCWLEGSIPADPKEVCLLLGMGQEYSIDEFKGAWALVASCFELSQKDPSRLVHLRLEKERKKQDEWKKKSVSGGKASAKARQPKDKSSVKGGVRVVEPPLVPNGNTAVCSLQSSSSSSLKPKRLLSGKPDPQEILDYLNLKVQRHFKLTPKHLKYINARINEGYSLDDFKKVVDAMNAKWSGDGDMMGYLRPITLFSPKMDSYLNQPDETVGKGYWEKVKQDFVDETKRAT